MKYNQPYGISDPNAAYINGNPSTGTMGSIPPAASIEHPQREIVNTIVDAGLLTPADTDLHQLAKAIQSGQLNYKHDTGTSNAYAAVMSPNPGSYFEGLSVILKVLNSNTGGSVLNLNSLGNKPIVRADGVTPLAAGDLVAGALVCFLYDGTNFRTVWTQSAASTGMPIFLTAPRTYYVNIATGNDSFDGSQATVGTGNHGPFRTIQKASNQIPLYNLNGWNITIYVADGTYDGFSVGQVNGSGSIILIGNVGSPAACHVHGVNQTAISITTRGSVQIRGFKVSNTGPVTASDPMSGLVASLGGTFVYIGQMEFGTCTGPSIYINWGAMASTDPQNVPWIISGSSSTFLNVISNALMTSHSVAGPNVNITAAVSLGTFVHCVYNSQATFLFGSLTGAGNVSATVRYDVANNSTISSNGGGANYYPGTTVGTAINGGYYV